MRVCDNSLIRSTIDLILSVSWTEEALIRHAFLFPTAGSPNTLLLHPISPSSGHGLSRQVLPTPYSTVEPLGHMHC